MKKSIIAVLAFLMCISVPSQAQDVQEAERIQFQNKMASEDPKFTNSMMISPKKIEDVSSFKGLPSRFHLFSVFSVVVNQERVVYENYLAGRMTREKYADYLQNIDGDISLLEKNAPAYKNSFHFYVGLDTLRREKSIIVDANNNLDFSDDKVYTLSLEDYEKKSWFATGDSQTLYPQVNISTGNHPAKISIAMHPYDSYDGRESFSTENEYYMDVLLTTNNYKQANVTVNGKEILINEFPNRISFIPEERITDKSTFFFFHPGDSVFPPTSRLGDTVVIADRKLFLQKEDHSLIINDLGDHRDSSRVGDHLPELYFNDTGNNKSVNITSLAEGKYVFIDFWGSWCAPCISSMPKLVKLYEAVKDRDDVLMLGLALENEKDLPKLTQAILDNNVGWINFWGSRAEMKYLSSPFKKLNIENYPTYMIVDNTGKIVYKKSNSLNVDEAVDTFLGLIERE